MLRNFTALFITLSIGLSFLASGVSAKENNRYVLTANGIGPIARGDVVTIKSLRKAYPELTFKTEIFQQEGLNYSRIVARRGSVVLFTMQLTDGKFRDIIALSPMVSDENGVTVGLAYGDVPITAASDCFLMADGAGYVACPSGPNKRLQYLFDTAPNLPRPNDPLKAIRVW